MGKESITFLTAWIILGKVFATFSTDPEPTTTISTSTSGSTDFGKTGTSLCCLQGGFVRASLMGEKYVQIRLIKARRFVLTADNPVKARPHFSACRAASHFIPSRSMCA